MEYRFAVQASNPRSLTTFDADDESLSDAIQTVFPLDAEFALIVWNWVYIPLTYKYDICMIAESLIGLLEAMLSEQIGKRTIQWPSNTFAATWNVEWSDGTATVHAEWSSILGETEAVLATRPTIVLPTADFIGEWKRPLEVIRAALDAAGYTPEHLAGMRRLLEVTARIDQYGILYRD